MSGSGSASSKSAGFSQQSQRNEGLHLDQFYMKHHCWQQWHSSSITATLCNSGSVVVNLVVKGNVRSLSTLRQCPYDASNLHSNMRHRDISKNSVCKDITAMVGTATALAREFRNPTITARRVDRWVPCFPPGQGELCILGTLSYPAHWEVWHGIVSISDFVCLMVEFRKRLLKLHSGERRSRLSAPSIGGR
jgi:hypothetical protein